MIYTQLTMKAMRLCYKAHAGQYDKGGVPYVFHPFHVDTPMTAEELREEEYPETVIEAVLALTRHEDEPYLDYIDRLKTNPIAKKVKLADLAHNSDQTRVPNADSRIHRMWEKYAKARKRLIRD